MSTAPTAVRVRRRGGGAPPDAEGGGSDGGGGAAPSSSPPPPHLATPGFRRKMQLFLDEPSSSRAAYFFAVFMLCVIGASVTVLLLSTLPRHLRDRREPVDVLELGERVFNFVFVAELIVRCAIAESCAAPLKDVYMWFDFLAVLPFVLESALLLVSPGGSTEAPPFAKALRMIRLLKIARQYDGSIVIVRAINVRAGCGRAVAQSVGRSARNSFRAAVVPFSFARRGHWMCWKRPSVWSGGASRAGSSSGAGGGGREQSARRPHGGGGERRLAFRSHPSLPRR